MTGHKRKVAFDLGFSMDGGVFTWLNSKEGTIQEKQTV